MQPILIKQAGKPGRRPTLSAAHLSALRTITQEQPRLSLEELTLELQRRTGAKVHPVTVSKAMRKAGIERLAPVRRPSARVAVQGGMPMHCAAASLTNTDLTDSEWALVGDLFEQDGKRGVPPRYERREVVNACCYALRTGCAWRKLPESFPPWQAVYLSFKRWVAAGRFEIMHDRLRQQWRERMGRAPEPSPLGTATLGKQRTAIGGGGHIGAGRKR